MSEHKPHYKSICCFVFAWISLSLEMHAFISWKSHGICISIVPVSNRTMDQLIRILKKNRLFRSLLTGHAQYTWPYFNQIHFFTIISSNDIERLTETVRVTYAHDATAVYDERMHQSISCDILRHSEINQNISKNMLNDWGN